MPPPLSSGLRAADLLSSDSLSSISSGLSSSLASEPVGAVSKQLTAKPGTAKAFVPPKIVPAKKIQKRPLPKRTPLPGAAPPEAPTKKGPLQREEQLAALQSQLMVSRANIGKRWEKAWRSAGSSQSVVSIGSDLDSLDDLSSSDFSSGSAGSGGRPLRRRSAKDSGASEARLSEDTFTGTEARRDIMALLERELSSDLEEMQDESRISLNLTSSGFIEDLALDLVPQPSDTNLSPPQEKEIMPRPLQKLKLRLFQGSGQDSSSSISSVESVTPPAVWRLLPSRETSVPEEQEESVEESEGEEEEEEEEEEESEEEASEVDETKEEEEEAASSTVSAPSADQAPQLRWEMEQVEEEQEKELLPATAPSPKVIRRPLRPADMKAEDRLEEDACQEDFDRREVRQDRWGPSILVDVRRVLFSKYASVFLCSLALGSGCLVRAEYLHGDAKCATCTSRTPAVCTLQCMWLDFRWRIAFSTSTQATP